MKLLQVKILFTFLLFISGCISNQKLNRKGNIEIETLRVLLRNKSNKKVLIDRFGKPKEKKQDRWVYYKRMTPKVWLFFKKDKLSHISYSIWEDENLETPNVFLNKINGNWTVITEPWSNPHAGPHLCYLEDLKSGKRAEVNSYKKTISDISIWTPTKKDKSIKEYLYSKVGKEFCIASSCSKITDPHLWDSDHCRWLKDLVLKHKKSKKK